MEEHLPEFSSIDEERNYYKALAMEYMQKLKEAQQELEEFQESSRELEAELEVQLEQAEGRNKELRSLNSHLQRERETLQEKLDILHTEKYRQITDLQDELADIRTSKCDLVNYVRELEQANDDLERAKRAMVTSLEDFESRLNHAIERNAFLENELDEKEALSITVQRLKDEARDLRQEMLIQQTSKPPTTQQPDNEKKIEKLTSEIDSNKLKSEIEIKTGSPIKNPLQLNNTCMPLTPSARISALNIVGDLLRKVGALESKLASCRSYVKDSPQRLEKDDSTNQIMSPTKTRHLSKGSPLASPQDYIPMTA